jgi:hypothetical protein
VAAHPEWPPDHLANPGQPGYPLAPKFSGDELTSQTLSIPRATHGLIMLAATVLAVAGGWAGARFLGGGSATSLNVLIALTIGSLATFAPVILRVGPDHWGVAVLFSGTARALIVLVACYLIAQNMPGLAERPLFLPAVGAVVFLLAVESVSAIRILSAIERQKSALKAGTT